MTHCGNTIVSKVLLTSAICLAAWTGPLIARSAPISLPAGARQTDDGWFAPRKPETAPPKLPKEVTRAFIIPIKGPISSATRDIVRYKVNICRSKKAEVVIFDMDTPGGAGDAMQAIMKMISEDLRDVYTIAYVNPNAYSAGALISLSCDEIVMAPKAVIGDSMPIIITPQGGLQSLPKAERAKIESPIRTMVVRLAKERGYNPSVWEAMVNVPIELWVIRHHETGELRIVDAAEWRGKVGDVPADNPLHRGPKDATWRYVRRFDPDDKLVTLSTDDAIFAGVATRKFDSMDDLRNHYNIRPPMERLEDRPLDEVAIFLTSPVIAGLLMTIMLICGFTELRTPGLGIFGAIAVLCLLTLIGSRFLVGLANPVEMVILAVGLVLIVLEIFVIPGFGAAGITGFVLCIAAMLAMLLPNAPTELPIPQTDVDWRMFENGAFWLAISFLLAIAASMTLSRLLPKTPVTRRIFLGPAEHVETPPVTESSPVPGVQIGDTGVVETMCRPVGKVRFGEVLLDATSEGDIIETGAAVRVLRREGNHVIIEKA